MTTEVNFITNQNRRAWLIAALVVFFGASCATSNPLEVGGPASSYDLEELRVNVHWRLDLTTDRPWQVDPRELGTPVISSGGDLLVGASDGWVYRIAAHSGDVKWATPTDGSIDAAANLASGRVYVGTDTGSLVALSWSDGEELWRFETRGSVDSTATVSGGRVLFTDSNDILYALDAVTGELLWDYQRGTPEFFTLKGGGTPLVIGSVVYSGFADGVLVALQVDSGDEIWAIHLGDETGEFGDIDLPIISDGERLIVASHAGGVYSVERATGALIWQMDIDNVVGLEAQGSWLFGATSTGRVFALHAESGQAGWQYRLEEGQSAMGISSAGRYLAVPAASGPLYLIKTQTGEPVAMWKPSSGFQHAPVFDETRGYILSNRGYLYGFGLAF